MTDQDLEALLELEARATEAPWGWHAEDASLLMLGNTEDSLGKPVLDCVRCKACQKQSVENFPCSWPRQTDADLIIVLRNNARSLLTELLQRRRNEQDVARDTSPIH